MRSALVLVMVALVGALALMPASAQATRGFHLFGDVALGGSDPTGAILRVTDINGTIDLSATYQAGDVDTSVGKMSLDDKFDASGGEVAGSLHFFLELPPGHYMFDVTTTDGQSARAEVTTGAPSGDLVEMPWGTYDALPIEGLALATDPQPIVVAPHDEPERDLRGWQLYGHVALAGAAKETSRLEVKNANGSISLSAGFSHEEMTPYGTIGLGPRHNTDASIVPDAAHFWVEVPAGTYNVTILSGTMRGSALVTTRATDDTHTLPHGRYMLQEVPEIRLGVAPPATTSPAGTTPAPPGSTTPAGTTPAGTSPATAGTSKNEPTETPGPSIMAAATALAGLALLGRRRAP